MPRQRGAAAELDDFEVELAAHDENRCEQENCVRGSLSVRMRVTVRLRE